LLNAVECNGTREQAGAQHLAFEWHSRNLDITITIMNSCAIGNYSKGNVKYQEGIVASSWCMEAQRLRISPRVVERSSCIPISLETGI